jgi:cytochrome P450
MLQFMLDAGKGGLLSDEEIVANAWVFILGGFETTASALTLSTFLIARHSKVQEKLFLELEKAFKVNISCLIP